MTKIRLSKTTWEYDEAKQLGEAGGFGAVFLGSAESGSAVAVKRLHLRVREHSSRELEIANYLLGQDHPHVIPILDVGLDEASGQYFIVMALADQSLQDLVDNSAPVAEHDALEIIDAIAAGLEEIKDLVHRDLKPGNVLLHNGVWKLADLGLARFVEESTSPNTMKGFLSAQYAAPEQWRLERATKATDVYALGCIIYALITGEPPFSGSTQEDFSRQHQVSPPPPLRASAQFRQMASLCLAKSQQVRPSVQSLRAQIQRARLSAGTATTNPLAAVGAIFAERKVAQEAEAAQQSKVTEDRASAAREAVANVTQILERLFENILADAPDAQCVEEALYEEKNVIRLGSGQLAYGIEFPYMENEGIVLHKAGKWDVIAGATVRVALTYHSSDVRGRSANLWFGKLAPDEGYRWWEVSYTNTRSHAEYLKSMNMDTPYKPFALYAKSGYQVRSVDGLRYGWYDIATNPKPIDGEYVDEFYSRWINWLAQAALYEVTWKNVFEPVPPNEPLDPRFS